MPLPPAPPQALPPPGPLLPLPAPPPASHALLSTRQAAKAFNQPLNFDTSKVTYMERMFDVRSARALDPKALGRVFPVHAASATTAPYPPASRPAPRPALHALLSTRQFASAFNQPLSWDTSMVTNMHQMFYVRSARVPWPPSLESGLPPVHAALPLALPLPHIPSRLPARTPRPASHALL